jgi:hypothetical protein
MGAKMTGDHIVEIFLPDGSRKWQARIAGRILKEAGKHPNPIAARHAVTQLFAEQSEPWKLDGAIDPNARLAHFHTAAGAPSLCGSIYHAPIPGAVVILPTLRAENVQIGQKVCAVCLSMIDRTPQPGDKVGTLGGKFGQVTAVLPKNVVVLWPDGVATEVSAGEVRPLFLEQFR